MSRTYKDRPWRLGGDRHKWFTVSNHGSHGSFTRMCRRLVRRSLDRHLTREGELLRDVPAAHLYFD